MSYSTLLRAIFVLLFLPLIPFPITFGLYEGHSDQAWQSTSSPELLITEFFYNPPGLDEEREWVEVANLSDRPIQLSGYGLGDEEQPGGGEGMLRFPEGSEIGAGEAIIVARTAVGFRALFGANTAYEIQDTDSAVSDMVIDSQWATGQFALANDGDEIILLDAENQIIDAVSYGDSTIFFSPSIPQVVTGQSVERFPAICDSDSAADWRSQTRPDPGGLSIVEQCAPVPEKSGTPQLRAIGEIQGAGPVSPVLNQVVTFRGLVTGLMEDQNASGIIYYTIFIQDMPGLEDGDPDTSDAVAVFLGRQQPVYQTGDQLLVTGQVTEYFGLTEIDDYGLVIELESSGQPLADSVVLDIPQDPVLALEYLEAHEGMLVRTDSQLPVFGPTHSGCGFAVGSRADATRTVLHTGLETYSPPILVLNKSDVDCTALPDLKSGDLVAGIAGQLTYHFEQFKVVQQHSEALQVEQGEPLPVSEPFPASADWVRVASLNLDNYLSPSLDEEDRQLGHPSPTEFEIKQRKLAYAIGNVLDCPELLGVQEVESEALLVELADMTADTCGFDYQVTHRESADGRGIDVALLSDPRHISIHDAVLHQTCSSLATGVWDSDIECAPGEEPLFSRPPLEISLDLDGNPLTIIVNHFKSKSGGELETAPRRDAQAQHLHGLVHDLLSQDPQAEIIVMGDFNDFNRSPVWQKLQEGGVLHDTMQEVPSQERYSYIFDGASQLIDGILVSPALVHRVMGAAVMHVNADYPLKAAFDESLAALPYHASDHDPLMITISTLSPTAEQKPTVEPTNQPDLEPSPTIQPTIQTAQNEEVIPTIQPGDPGQTEEAVGSRQPLAIAGLALLLAASALWWLVRRKSN